MTTAEPRLLIALVAWGVLAFGAVYPWAYWPLFAVAALLGAWWTMREHAWRDERLWRVALALVVVAAVAGLQVMSVPGWLVQQVSPAVDPFLQAWVVGYEPGSHRTLSIAPEATLVVIAEIVAFGCLFVGLARVLRTMSLSWLATQLAGLGATVSVLGLVQALVIDDHSPQIFGFWRTEAGGSPFGPFVNRNHFAGWTVMMLPVVLSGAWAAVERARQSNGEPAGGWSRWAGGADGNRLVFLVSSALIMAVAVVLTRSRSGLVSLAVSLGVLFVLLAPRLQARARWVSGTALFALLVGAVVWAGPSMVAARFERASADMGGRWSAWRDTIQIVRDFPIVGTGLGGYDRAMLVYQTGERTAHYAEAHNDYLQLLAEGGLAGAGATIGVIVIFSMTVRRRLGHDEGVTATLMRRGAVAGLVGIATQSLVEFSLQIPGNALVLAVLAALALHRSHGHTHAYRS